MLLQAGWNFLRYQSVGFTFIMLPTLRKIYNKRELKNVLIRYLENFNTNPVMSVYAAGALMRLEESEVRANKFKQSDWVMTKTFLMSTLASMGDRFFWDTLKPFAFIFSVAAGAIFSLDVFKFSPSADMGNWEVLAVAAVYLLTYNIPALYTRWKGISLSYNASADDCYGMLAFDWNKAIKRIKWAGFICTIVVACAAMAGQFLYMPWGEEFLLAGGALLVAAVSGLLFEKANVSMVYVYLGLTAITFTTAVFL